MKKILAVLAAVLLCSAGADAARAATPFVSAGSFAADQFSRPQRVAVEPATGRIVVADGNAGRVVVYAPTAAGADQLTEFGGGELDHPVGVAIDHSNGDVYVADSGHQRVARYVSDGQPTPTYTLDAGYAGPASGPGATQVADFAAAIAIDPTNRDLLVADPDPTSGAVKRYDSGGTFLDSFDGTGSAGGLFTRLLDLAVDSTGDVIVIDATGDIAYGGATSRVERFSSTGVSEGAIGALTAPSTVAVVPGTDQVVVASNQNSYFSSQPLRISVFDPDGSSVSDVDLPGATIYGLVTGVAAGDDSFHRLYVVTDKDLFSNFFGAVGIQRLVLDLRPTLASVAAAGVTARSATLAGTINPNGAATTYQVEYRVRGAAEWVAGLSAVASAGSGTAPEPFSVTLDDLRPNTDYDWRVVAGNALLSSTATASFHTGAAAPRAETLPASERTTTSLRINGVVDPYGQPTTYYLEYGYDTNYGTAVPAAADRDAGAGSKPTRFSKVLTNLIPGRALHFRIVASNASGTTTGADRTAEPIATERAYEMVSSADKRGGNVSPFEPTQAATSGDAVMYASSTAHAGAEGAVVFAPYVAKRTANGWITTAQTPPLLNQKQLFGRPVLGFSRDLTKAMVMSQLAIAPGAHDGQGNIFLQDTATRTRQYVGGSTDPNLLDELGNAASPSTYAGASDDFGHVAFWSSLQVTPDAPAGVTNVYEIADGRIRLVNVLEDGTPSNGARYAGDAQYQPDNHSISSDGRRIFFIAPDQTGSDNLYMREDGVRTVRISPAPRADAPPGLVTAPNWGGATPDGSTVVFETRAALSDDATNPTASISRVYRFHAGTLTEIAAGSVPGVQVTNVSDDGKYVYFVTPTALDDVSAATPHMYVWHEGDGVRLVARLEGLRADTGSVGLEVEFGPEATSISPGGRYLTFESFSQLTDENTRNAQCVLSRAFGSVRGHCAAVYVYDAVGATLTCVSCAQSGAAPSGHAAIGGTLLNADLNRFGSYSRHYPRAAYDDGAVYFDSSDSLLPEDTDGRRDGYSWRDGELTLLTPGTATDSVIADVGADQRDVFILTNDRLVGLDRDDNRDVYDARIGGGLASQQAPDATPPCVGDLCQGAAPVPAKPAEPASTGVGAGDVAPAVRAAFTVTALTSRQRAALARGERVSLRARVTAPGTITATLSASIGKRQTRLASATRTATRAGVVSVPIRLTAAARRSLARHRSLKATLSVRVSGVREARTLAVPLKAKAKKQKSNQASVRPATRR